MAGIVGYGAFIPRNRIKAEEIARQWGKDPVAICRGLLLERTGLKPADFRYAVFHMLNGKFPLSVGADLGFTKKQLEEEEKEWRRCFSLPPPAPAPACSSARRR